ncbi:hypothetical protein ART_3569 [Arthrobacter sp. PAMC 25486]|uniref:hypothetical protein n=1 Tax=Arthrobacter sp. PAMC 25486 TaxID=1494608 RepID=UPI0005360476|nr:hypothetical protein [Arthrobacter sp. PAMC 25486]AIY03168.1 hypothetical protein ART_3569 [Arthrobacter sp. PAMC 25486]
MKHLHLADMVWQDVKMTTVVRKYAPKALWLIIGALLTAATLVVGLLVWHQVKPLTDGVQLGTEGASVAVAFPSSLGTKAAIKPTAPTEEMIEAAPNSFKLVGVAEFEVTHGEFPEAGALVSINLPAPLAEGHELLITHWNEDVKTWEPATTDLSADRMIATAQVPHFSKYGFWDYLFNAANQVMGNAATTGVTCDAPLPDWVEPEFFDDINGPVLWCGGRDAYNPDILVAKLKMNRGYAAKITTALDPEYKWSDLWDGMGPETMVNMLAMANLSSVNKTTNDYIVQPLGEYSFGFNRGAVEKFYADGKWDKPLIEVSVGWVYTAFGFLYSELKDAVGGDVAATFTALALAQCAYDVNDGVVGTDSVSLFTTSMSCIETSLDGLHNGALAFLTKKLPKTSKTALANRLKPAAAKMKTILKIYSAASMATRIMTSVGDQGLTDITRQFLYSPSLKAIQDAAAAKKSASLQTFTTTSADLTFSFKYPASWAVIESDVGLKILNAEGEQLGHLQALLVWGSEGLPITMPILDPMHTGSFIVQEPCTDCTLTVTSKILDAAQATGAADYPLPKPPMEVLNWPKRFGVFVAPGKTVQPSTVDPRLTYAVLVLNPTERNSFGYESRVLLVGGRKYFSTLPDAQAWMESDEHGQLVDLMASIRANTPFK